jgi:hypothetical protein
MYLGLGTATPIFVGGLLRWLADRARGVSASEAETETSPSVLLSSGYIAGGTLCGLLIGFLVMLAPKPYLDQINLGQYLGPAEERTEAGLAVLKPDERVEKWHNAGNAKILAVGAFLALAGILLWVGMQKNAPLEEPGDRQPPPDQL